MIMRASAAPVVREAEAEPYGAAAVEAADADGAPGGEASFRPGDSAPAAATPEERAEADDLDALGEEIIRLAGHEHAFKARQLELIAEFDRREGWKSSGRRSCALWLAARAGYRLSTAREYVRVARALEELPLTGQAMARGRLSFCQARALTRVATPETEAELLPLAEGCTVARLERMVRAWKKGTRGDEEARERERFRSRRLVVFPDHDGMVVLRGRLTPEVGEVLMRALEVRDRGCRFPGCGLRFTDGHHIRHWADGGGTSLENCVLLCRFHHRLVHEEGWTVQWWGRGKWLVFRDPRGGIHTEERTTERTTVAEDPVRAVERAMVRRKAQDSTAP